jgi:hypothetical protein
LEHNSTLTKLDVSSNQDANGYSDADGFAQELAVGLRVNNTLLKLVISNNALHDDATEELHGAIAAGDQRWVYTFV